MRHLAPALLLIALTACAGGTVPDAEPDVFLDFVAEISTVYGDGLGFSDDDVGTVGNGSFGFDSTQSDLLPDNPDFGIFNDIGGAVFEMTVGQMSVGSSERPIIDTWFTTGHHFVFADGDDPARVAGGGGEETGEVTIDGLPDDRFSLDLVFLDHDGVTVDSDALPSSFDYAPEDGAVHVRNEDTSSGFYMTFSSITPQ